MSSSSSSKMDEDCLPRPIGDIDLQKKAEELGIKYFLPCISMPKGLIRADLVPRSAGRQLQQRGFASMVLMEYGVTGSDPELMCVPDPTTLIQLPWDPEIGWLACNAYFKGKRFDQCPRLLLQKLCKQADEMGYVMKTGIEPEFVLLDKDKHEVLVAGEMLFSKYQNPNITLRSKAILTRIMDYMDQLGWEPYQALREAMSNQYEINWKYADALTTADRHLFLKFMIKEIARLEGCRATFMPAPFEGEFVNGMHIHVSLWKNGENVFPDSEGHLGISDVGRQFMAGVLKHSRVMCGLMCPTVNSYKRLWAWPNLTHHVSYGRDNRWALMRIPEASATNDRFEYRSPDGSTNPYLLQAAMLMAGLDGIRNKTALEPNQLLEDDMWEKPEIENHYEDLPRNLQEACELLTASSFLKEQLGAGLVKAFQIFMTMSWKEYHKQITAAEIQAVDDY